MPFKRKNAGGGMSVNKVDLAKYAKYAISDELMKELAQNRWKVIEIAFNQGINAMFDIIDERLRKLGG